MMNEVIQKTKFIGSERERRRTFDKYYYEITI